MRKRSWSQLHNHSWSNYEVSPFLSFRYSGSINMTPSAKYSIKCYSPIKIWAMTNISIFSLQMPTLINTTAEMAEKKMNMYQYWSHQQAPPDPSDPWSLSYPGRRWADEGPTEQPIRIKPHIRGLTLPDDCLSLVLLQVYQEWCWRCNTFNTHLSIGTCFFKDSEKNKKKTNRICDNVTLICLHRWTFLLPCCQSLASAAGTSRHFLPLL